MTLPAPAPPTAENVLTRLDSQAKLHPGFLWANTHRDAAALIRALQAEIEFLKAML